MSGRTFWLKKDAGWWERGAVRRARKEFGPTGPAVMDWLECAAKRQNAGGQVKADPMVIAEDIGAEEVTVCHVLSHLVQKTWVVSYETDGDLFKAKIAWFEADQRRGDDAERKAESRAKEPVSDSLSRSVTVSPHRVEKSREEIEEASASSKPESSVERETRLATDSDREACRRFYELGRVRNPKLPIPASGSNAWATALGAMRKLRELDDQSPAEIDRLMEWVFTAHHQDAVFWGTTIQSPAKLRDKFSQVWSKMEAASTVIPLGAPRSGRASAGDLLRVLDEADAADRQLGGAA
jgi:hypothetical protein